MTEKTTYDVEILNSSGSGSDQTYYVYSATPEVSGKVLQQSDISRIVCKVVGPIEDGDHEHFRFTKRYFGFIGRIHVIDGKTTVEDEMQREVDLGSDANNGTYLDACVSNGGGLSIQVSPQQKSAYGSFTIRCRDPKPSPHDVVVGLAYQFDGELVPVSAVPYEHGVNYAIKPKGAIYIARHEDMTIRQIIPSDVSSSGQQVAFQGSQVRARVEDSMGRLSLTMSGSGSTASVPGSTTGTAQQQAPQKPVAIAVMGITGSGKSTLIKQVTGQHVPVGDGIFSTTVEVATYKTTIGGKEVLLVDTPGFDDSSRNEGEILESITSKLAQMYVDTIPISGIIYVHDITNEKFTGSAGRYLLMFTRIVGPNALRNVTFLTTKWDRDSKDNGKAEKERREKMFKDRPWQELIKQGASVRRIGLADGRSAYVNIVREVLRNVAATLQIQQELVDDKLPLKETSAGRVLDEQIRKATEAIRKELLEVQQQLLSSDNQHSKQVKELRTSLEEEKQRLNKELQKSEQSRNAIQQQFDGFKTLEESRAQQLQRTIDELRQQQQQQRTIDERRRQEQQKTIDELRRQQQQQQPPPPRPAPQLTPQTVSAPAYGISVHHRNSASSLTVIEKACHYDGSWTQISDGHKLVMPGSGSSGLLRFRSSNGEQIGVAVGVHNYVRWCDITDFSAYESCSSHQARYYNGSDPKHKKLWQQAASCSARSSRGMTVSLSYYVAHGNELHATLSYY